tara:strand:+ start:7043 stop:8224 length:1182 start_codon:yes stop_codon:yes gene_type:complete
MIKIQNFKSFSQLKTQLREDATKKEMATKREVAVSEYNTLLAKFNISNITELSEEDRTSFMAELTKEGNAFGAARAEAIAKGDDKFKVDGEEVPVKDADAEDEENAKEFVDEAELSSKANPRLYTKVENKLKSQKYNSDAEHHLTLLKSMDPKKLSRSDLDTLSDFDDMYESVNEGFKREAGKVATAWKKVMKAINASEERSINVIAKVYALAMGDANFHREAHTSKAIGSQTTPGVKTDFDRFASDIARAADWGGIYIAQGTLAYLKAIGEDKIAARFEKKINKEDDLHESVTVLNEAAMKSAGLSKEETLKVAKKFADALAKADNVKVTVNKGYDEDSFDLDYDGKEFEGGSYNINADGSVVNMALPGTPSYGMMDDDMKTIVNLIKMSKK